MKYTKVSSNTFKELVLNAGVVLSTFDPTSPAAPTDSTILFETSGGVSFSAAPSFVDFGDGIDNVPANTKELKRIESWEVKLSGSYISMTPALAAKLAAAADLTVASGKITPRMSLKDADFDDVWWVGDYSDINDDEASTAATGGTDGSAGFVAIHVINALNTNGFDISSEDKGKTTGSFEFTGHYSIDDPETVPFEIYIKAGTAPVNPAG